MKKNSIVLATKSFNRNYISATLLQQSCYFSQPSRISCTSAFQTCHLSTMILWEFEYQHKNINIFRYLSIENVDNCTNNANKYYRNVLEALCTLTYLKKTVPCCQWKFAEWARRALRKKSDISPEQLLFQAKTTINYVILQTLANYPTTLTHLKLSCSDVFFKTANGVFHGSPCVSRKVNQMQLILTTINVKENVSLPRMN